MLHAALLSLHLAAFPAVSADGPRVDFGLSSSACATCLPLLAQTSPPPPPLTLPPNAGTQPGSTGLSAPPSATGLPAGLDPRELQLTQEIADLNAQIRGVDTDWPILSIVMAYLGFIFGPPTLLTGGVVLLLGNAISGVGGSAASPLVTTGTILIVVGVGLIALAIVGVITGLNFSAEGKELKDALVAQRTAKEAELNEYKRGKFRPASERFEPSPRLGSPVLATVFRF